MSFKLKLFKKKKIHKNESNKLMSFFLTIKSLLMLILSYILYHINLNVYDEIKILKDYYKINNAGILLNNQTKFKKVNNPKISIISPVYNNEKYILRFIRSIQNQFFDDLEIILVDDCSQDNSTTIIERYQREDERIILLKNHQNKGTLISRNLGALKSKGEYLIFPDSDDMMEQNSLKKCYEAAVESNFDMIRFNMYSDLYFVFGYISNSLKIKIYQPELRTYLVYGGGNNKLVDGVISNKFIKRNIFIKTLNNIDKYYLEQNMKYFEDGLMNYALYLNSESLYLFKTIAYYYVYNEKSSSRALNEDLYITCYFLYMKYILENLKNEKYERDIIFYLIDEYFPDNNMFESMTKYVQICIEVIDQILEIKDITNFHKNKLNDMKNIIISKKNQTNSSFII